MKYKNLIPWELLMKDKTLKIVQYHCLSVAEEVAYWGILASSDIVELNLLSAETEKDISKWHSVLGEKLL